MQRTRVRIETIYDDDEINRTEVIEDGLEDIYKVRVLLIRLLLGHGFAKEAINKILIDE